MLEDQMNPFNMSRTIVYGGISFALVLRGESLFTGVVKYQVLYKGDLVGSLMCKDGEIAVRATSEARGDLRQFDGQADRDANETAALRWVLGEWLNRQTDTVDPCHEPDPLGPAGGQVIPGLRVAPPVPPMDLRDWFAGQALVAVISVGRPSDGVGTTFDMMAQDAYRFADAMLAERVARGAVA